jgi:hypothetical protein
MMDKIKITPVRLQEHTQVSLLSFLPQNLTFVSEAPGIPDPVFLQSSKMFFNSEFSALNYKYNNNNTMS